MWFAISMMCGLYNVPTAVGPDACLSVVRLAPTEMLCEMELTSLEFSMEGLLNNPTHPEARKSLLKCVYFEEDYGT